MPWPLGVTRERTFGDIFPAIGLVNYLRRARAGGAGTGRAIIMPFQRNAIAFVLGWLIRDRSRRGGRSKERECGSFKLELVIVAGNQMSSLPCP